MNWIILLFFAIFFFSNQALSELRNRVISKKTSHGLSLAIPSSCIAKGQTLVSTAAMSSTDRSQSIALVSALATAGSTFNISYSFTPQLIQSFGSSTSTEGVGTPAGIGVLPTPVNFGQLQPRVSPATNSAPTAQTEIKLRGMIDSLQINLISANGQIISTSQVFSSLSEAQTASASASSNMVQTSGNEASLSLDLVASDILSFYTTLGLHSSLQSQAVLQAGINTSSSTSSLPLAMGYSVTLADIINSIEILANVTFDGDNLNVSIPATNIGC